MRFAVLTLINSYRKDYAFFSDVIIYELREGLCDLFYLHKKDYAFCSDVFTYKLHEGQFLLYHCHC